MTGNEKYLDYLKMLRKPYVKLCRLRFLQPDGSTAFMLDNRTRGKNAGAFIADGSISHNWQNGRRTNASVTLDNLDGDFDYNFNKVWFGQEIALDEGMILSDGVTEFYIQQGVFLIETPTESVNPAKRTITYSLVDKTAALDGTLGGNLDGTYQVPVGTNIFTPITALLSEDKGNGYPIDHVTPVFTEYYNNRTQTLPDGTVVSMVDSPYTLTVDGTDGTIWQVISGLAAMVNGWIGYDETGALRIDPSQDDILDTDKPVLWQFSTDEAELLGLTYTVKNTEVYNDYIVIGEALSDGSQPSGRAQIVDPRSPVDIHAIGQKTIRVSQVGFGTVQQCQDYAVWMAKRSAVLQSAVSISCSQILHIRGNNLVTITRTDKPGNPTERHLVMGFSRSLTSTDAMTISVVSVNDFPITSIAYVGMISYVPSQNGGLTYNGTAQTPTWLNYSPVELAISGTTSATNVGNYNATFTPNTGYIWWDGTSTGKQSPWSIWKQPLAIPTVSGSYTYSGSTQTLVLDGFDSNTMNITGTTSATNSGTYTATVSLKSTTNYQWGDGTTSNKTITWKIAKQSVAIPTAIGTYTYTGSAQTLAFSGFDANLMTKGGTYSATNAGSYTATISLTSTTNYQWSNGTTTAKIYNWSIGKATPQAPTLSVYSVSFSNIGSTTFTVSRTGNGAVQATSSNTSIATASVSGTTVTVNAVGELGNARITVTIGEGTNYKAYTATNVYCTVAASGVDLNNCLSFSSSSSFTLRAGGGKTWDGTMEWTNGNRLWTVWDGASVSSGSNNTIYLRGTGNTVISGSNYGNRLILTGGKIDCSGNAETLLDYADVANGVHPTMAAYGLANVFAGNAGLTSAPTLPATTLANYCYQRTFSGCTSLTTAPTLPATSLAAGCYYYMFVGCTGLVSPPNLPATTLASSCYASMFYNCSSLKVSATQTGSYQNAYRIPKSGTGTTVTGAMSSMFFGTGGTFTGTPTINTTYYVTEPPVG